MRVRLVAWLAFATTLGVSAAEARPTRWRLVADERLASEQQLSEEVEAQLLLKRRRERSGPSIEDSVAPPSIHAHRARAALVDAEAERAQSPDLRFLFGRVEQQLQNYERARDLFSSVITDASAHPALVGDAYADLAIVFAHLREVEREVEVEDLALAFEPIAISRALILANQAEGFMGLGDIRRAVQGYRAALVGLGTYELAVVAPTTLFSLGVALDRSGDLDAGLEQIARARTYDPLDRRLRSDSWFYSVPHDQAWYEGLGHWLVGRRGDGDEVRMAAYERAVISFKLYIARAPEGDRYLGLARLRLAQLEKEAAAHAKRARTPTPIR